MELVNFICYRTSRFGPTHSFLHQDRGHVSPSRPPPLPFKPPFSGLRAAVTAAPHRALRRELRESETEARTCGTAGPRRGEVSPVRHADLRATGAVCWEQRNPGSGAGKGGGGSRTDTSPAERKHLLLLRRGKEECETGTAETLKLRLFLCRQLCPTLEPVPQENSVVSVRRWDRPLWLTLPWVTGDSMVWLAPPSAPPAPAC
ncbi:hypothetical protein PFLUV_G00094400 [Perca fluviatilis]|uniref:Uncharacterized protein n=1 Tax=Perca fluviatilis TaxID=8168 RepID=A0A6A5EB50_PERFL|nr:hypothetical protein PFLUV_G00094400 [Perca fluviatilis]